MSDAHSFLHTSSARSRPVSPRSEFLAGARDIFPLIVGAIPFGIIFGTLASSNGLSVGGTLAMSAIVFAGSSQFIAAGMIAAGTGWLLIVLTAFVVNLRHLLYSVSLVPHVKALSQRWKVILGFLLTDEAFAIVIRRYEARDRSPFKHWYYLGAALAMYINWQLSTLLGITVGQLIPNAAEWGLDFAMSVTFLGMTILYVKTKPMGMAVVVAGLVALLANPLPHKLGLMVAAIAGILAGVYSERVLNFGSTDNE
ncbi:MAG: AzlC family ABC transporter permease [Cyanobacteria bacterium J06639_16]